MLSLYMFPFFGNIIGRSTTAPEMAQSVPFRRLRVNAPIFLLSTQKRRSVEAEMIKSSGTDFVMKYSVTKRAQC